MPHCSPARATPHSPGGITACPISASSTRKSSWTTIAGRGTSAGSTAPIARAKGFNPLCGDRLTLFLDIDGDRIKDVTFEGTGCAISRASASLMTDALKGKTVGRSGRVVRALPPARHLGSGRRARHERPRQARRVRRRARASQPDQVRDALMAHAQGGSRRAARRRSPPSDGDGSRMHTATNAQSKEDGRHWGFSESRCA